MSKVCVEIELETDDGSFTVSRCDPSEDAPDQAGSMPGAEAGDESNDGQKYSSMKDALMAAAKLLTENVGENTDAQAGFDSVNQPQKPGMM